ncbi:MAG: gliding motility-associated C-terminal domain-containing protein, partial [Saprospiraceae bacterium]|nr:gliding motility-associated C-terminal domain-containing protein [Saprospiraceae bacterium]
AGLDEGWYSIIVQDALGCESEAVDAYIDIPDPLVIEIGAQVTILQGESQQLQVLLNVPEDQVQEVIWTPSLGLSCIDCLDPIASPLSTTIYQVEVILFGDCRTLDEVEIVVDERPAIYAPNIFSPDGDGDNDLFYLFARPGNIRNIKSFLVFSRWGETVFSYYNFQPNDPAFGWNGNFRGQPLNPAVFVWYAEVELIDGRIELFKGDVTIVR